MSQKWDGKTRGSLWGYKFFIRSIQLFGVRFAYFFCIFVSGYFVLFAKKQRSGLISFYRKGFGYSHLKALRTVFKTFFRFGQILIDRIALKTKRKEKYTFEFNNEAALINLNKEEKGGFLFSGHVGNWENAGSLIGDRITKKINILMLDEEVEKIKSHLESQVGKANFNLIPLKNDMSHLILIHQALKKNELIALHADRVSADHKNIRLPFLKKEADFPLGPFIMAYKFKVPVTFVFAVKSSGFHYRLSATDAKSDYESPEHIAKEYVHNLEKFVKENPTQWFNFFEYYAD